MKKLFIILGILSFIILMYFLGEYQVGVIIPEDIDRTDYEFFYRIGYMSNDGMSWLFLLTLVVPAVLLAIGTTINIKEKEE